MDPQESGLKPLPSPKKRHILRKISIGFLTLFLLIYLFLFFGLNYFGEKFLRRFLQEKVANSSHGLYKIDFKTLDFNILTGKVKIDSLELIPDSVRYRLLKSQKKISTALYEVRLASLIIDRIHFWQIYSTQRFYLRQLLADSPMLKIVAYPDSVKAKNKRWQVVYEDIYPAISKVFNDFHIDSVKAVHGFFLSGALPQKNKTTSGEYEFSATLRDLSVNPFSYYNPDRVFYSRDVELVIHNIDYALADSLYFFRAKEVGFSLTRSYLFGKKISLHPNLGSGRLKNVRKGDFYKIDVPSFFITGIDLYKAVMAKKVDIGKVDLKDIEIKIFRNIFIEQVKRRKASSAKIRLNDLYSVISKDLRSINIDTLSVEDASLDFYGNPQDRHPEIRLGRIDITLEHFKLDSTTKADHSRFFYSNEAELAIENFAMKLRDGIHEISAGAVYASTRRSVIRVGSAVISPNESKNMLNPDNRRNTTYLLLPELSFNGINLKRVFNRRILTFDRLVINEPEVRYTQHRPPANPDPRFKKPGDFFAEQNEDFFFSLMKKYLWSVQANEIKITQGNFRYATALNEREIPVTKMIFDLSMQDFMIDSLHGMNQQGYFYSRDFDLNMRSVSFNSPDSLNRFEADSIHIVTKDSVITAYRLSFHKIPKPDTRAGLARKPQVTIGFNIRKLRLTGLNHRKLFLEKVLRANDIVVDNPSVQIKSELLQHHGALADSVLLPAPNEFIRTFEIGQLKVNKGGFSYNGHTDRKSTVFSLNDIDFTIQNGVINVPRKGVQEGLIRFDSLSLSVFPFRAVLADSSYQLEAERLKLHSYPLQIIAEGVKVNPLKTALRQQPGENRVSFYIPRISLNGFYFDKAIFDRNWQIDHVIVDQPELSVSLFQDSVIKTERRSVELNEMIQIPPVFENVSVNKLLIYHAGLNYSKRKADKVTSGEFKEITVSVTGFHFDSLTRLNPNGAPIFFSDNLTVSVPGFSFKTSDSLYTLSSRSVSLSTNPARVRIDTVALNPRYDRAGFAARVGYQTDRLTARLDRIGIRNIDFRRLAREGQLHAGSVYLFGFMFESYRDKRMPFPQWQRPLMPQQAIRKITFPVVIDTIRLTGGFASYEEQTGPEPGRLFFSDLNTTVTGFNTLSGVRPDLMVNGSGMFMGQSPFEARFRFMPDNPRDSFQFSATIGNLDLRSINPMLNKLMPVSVRQGTATDTKVQWMHANDSLSVGYMTFPYTNLAVKLHPAKKGTAELIETLLLNELVNLLLPDNNPPEGKKLEAGLIFFERDKSKGFFNFVWKSVLSGIRSSAGFNSKEQKAILEAEKRGKKKKQ